MVITIYCAGEPNVGGVRDSFAYVYVNLPGIKRGAIEDFFGQGREAVRRSFKNFFSEMVDDPLTYVYFDDECADCGAKIDEERT
jgi:hypothetical protein